MRLLQTRGNILALLSLLVASTLAGVLAPSPLTSTARADLPPGGTFVDDDGNIHEGNIEAIAAAGITSGCNPPTNDHYCPSGVVERGPMAAFIRRALELPSATRDYFVDDNDSPFESDINAIAAAGITNGCNPPTNHHFCPDGTVHRDELASFLARALELSPIAVPPRTANVLWSAGMESGDLSEWAGVSASSPGGSSTEYGVASSVAHSGQRSMYMRLVDSVAGTGIRARVDNNIPGYSGGENLPDDAYYSAWYYIPTHVDVSPNHSWNIFQWKQTCTVNGNPTRCHLEHMKLVDLDNGRYGFWLNSWTDSDTGDWGNGIWIILAKNEQITVGVGEWFHIESRRVYDQGTNGRITTWVNGQQIWDVTGIKTEHNWDYSFQGWRRQWTVNSYNTASNGHTPSTHTLYVDDATVALTRQGP